MVAIDNKKFNLNKNKDNTNILNLDKIKYNK